MVTPRTLLVALGLLVTASPAAAQWARVVDLPAANVFSVWTNGDTIAAGVDTAVYVSTNAGLSWRVSSKVTAGVTSVPGLRVRNGRLYAGTFGQGVFVSDDLGDTWQAFNQGLVGGILNSQLFIDDFEIFGDKLYAATSGAGVYVRNLAAADTWHHFGEEFEPNQASTVDAILLSGTRLVAAAGGNGSVFHRDPGDADWTISWLDNVGLHPGTEARSLGTNGTSWVAGSNSGIFVSAAGQEPWTRFTLGVGQLGGSAFTARGRRYFAGLDIVGGSVVEHSGDDGVTWEFLGFFPGTFVFRMAMRGTDLYVARNDGLWRLPTATLAVPPGDGPAALRFGIAGRQPVGDDVRFRFELPAAGSASLEVFDAAGRRAAERVQGSWSAGAHELAWDASRLSPGVYEARLTAQGRQAVVRLVHVR